MNSDVLLANQLESLLQREVTTSVAFDATRSMALHARRTFMGKAILKNVDIHELSEFHIFHGRGIHPFRPHQFIAQQGIVDNLHFTPVYQFALLRDSGFPIPVEAVPDWLFRLSGPLSLSVSITGAKA